MFDLRLNKLLTKTFKNQIISMIDLFKSIFKIGHSYTFLIF